MIGETANHDVTFGVPEANAEDADTVLLCTADEAGNVVAYINSRFAGFGSGLVAGDTGIALQNRGSSFSLDRDHPNTLAPGKRPFHTLIPALADFAPDADHDDWAAFGVMGGYMQPQGHLQVIS
ncbi:MAG: gamma-glutamyltransferase, partial [halophilic archaeon J07HB67]